jgi:hypothetical protein
MELQRLSKTIGASTRHDRDMPRAGEVPVMMAVESGYGDERRRSVLII